MNLIEMFNILDQELGVINLNQSWEEYFKTCKSEQCLYCGKYYSKKGIGTHIWKVHGDGKNHDPNIGYKNGTRVSWNKGLTKETHPSILRYSEINAKKYFPLYDKLNDDGKLNRKYKSKRDKAKHVGIGCELTLYDFCQLVDEAGLKSSQLGRTGEGYDLARYNDTGPYKIGNCRFISHRENMHEQKRFNK